MPRLVDVEICEECRYEYSSQDESTIPAKLRTLGDRYRAPLSRFLPGEDGDTIVRAHPVEGTWSALEYACHVRDVLQVQHERIALALEEETPTFEPMRRDERVTELAYNEQAPAEVASNIATAAGALADAFEGLSTAEWERTGIYSYPEPAERSILWIGQHTIHEAHHHLLDVGRILRARLGDGDTDGRSSTV